jgi:hypothetical protein
VHFSHSIRIGHDPIQVIAGRRDGREHVANHYVIVLIVLYEQDFHEGWFHRFFWFLVWLLSSREAYISFHLPKEMAKENRLTIGT